MNKRPERLCMAPWVHTYLSPQTERRMCCASREPAQSFRQYIDTTSGTGNYSPVALDQHWNSDHMRSVRRRMMANESLPECSVCDEQLLNTDVYRSYFNQLFGADYDSCMAATDSTGYTRVKPVSWDYRFSNLCNFKCRMCGDMLSSSWESEQRTNDMIDWANEKNNWMQPAVRKEISQFQDTQIEAEFAAAVEEHRIREVYWVGGEPLMYEQHWRYMKRIIELGDGPGVYARYNTNLSRVTYKGINLYRDILVHIRDWQICASLDGTGQTGEYIRTGLNYAEWLTNFRQGLQSARNRRQMRIDFTLTLPGLFEIERIDQLAAELNVDVLAKVVFAFSPDIVLSPLALPKTLLHSIIDRVLSKNLTSPALVDMLTQLKNRATHAEAWPETASTALATGKRRIVQLERIRNDSYCMSDILAADPAVLEWWNQIGN